MILFGLAVLQSAGASPNTRVTVPPAYYSYAGLSKQLETQHVIFDVSTAPHDLLVLAIRDRPISSVWASIERIGGVKIVANGNAWKVGPDDRSTQRDKALSQRYLADYARQLCEALDGGLALFRDYSATSADRQEALRQEQDAILNDPAAIPRTRLAADAAKQMRYERTWYQLCAVARGQIADSLLSHDLTVRRTTLRGKLDLPEDSAEGRMWREELPKLRSGITEPPIVFEPQSDAIDKAWFDPLIGSFLSQAHLESRDSNLTITFAMGGIVPPLAMPRCPWKSYLSDKDRSDVEMAEAKTLVLASDPVFKIPVSPQARLSFSQQILYWASHSEQDVAFKVDPSYDIRTNWTSDGSVQGWFEAAVDRSQSMEILSDELSISSHYNYGDQFPHTTALTPNLDYTLDRHDGVWEIANQLEFVQKMVGGQADLIESLERSLADGRDPSLHDLIEIARSPVWTTQPYALVPVALRRFDFAAARPFLCLIDLDHPLMTKIEAMPRDGTVTQSVGSFSTQVREKFFDLLRIAGAYCESHGDMEMPFCELWSRKFATEFETSSVSIQRRVVSGKSVYSFGLNYQGSDLWTADVPVANSR